MIDGFLSRPKTFIQPSLEVGDGEKGPLTVDVLRERVQARTLTSGTGPEELLFITRERQTGGTFMHDY